MRITGGGDDNLVRGNVIAHNGSTGVLVPVAISFLMVACSVGINQAAGTLDRAIEVEVWRVPASEYGSFVAAIPSPLGIGRRAPQARHAGDAAGAGMRAPALDERIRHRCAVAVEQARTEHGQRLRGRDERKRERDRD